MRVHPESGERVLYVNPSFTTEIVDLSPRESRHVLDLLFAELARPEYTVRFKWEPGSVAFWDNRAALHLAPRDFEHVAGDRVLHRITLVGDVPVGIDGRESTSLEGEPFRARLTSLIELVTVVDEAARIGDGQLPRCARRPDAR